MSLINLAFKKVKTEKRPALLTYTVAGDNTKKKSLEILKSIAKYADICEIGFPHNTPIADGGQIQSSAYRALKNGIKIKDVFSIVKDFKKSTEFALKSLDVVKSSKAVPEHSIWHTYSNVVRSFLELGDFENATNYSLENINRLNKTNSVNDTDLAACHNLLGINYKTIAEKIEDEPASIANYEKAMQNYYKAFTLFSEENLNQKFKRLRALLESKTCESQLVFGNKKVKKPKINSLSKDLNDALSEIKKPEISSLYSDGMLKKNINKLIETAESTILKLKNLNKT